MKIDAETRAVIIGGANGNATHVRVLAFEHIRDAEREVLADLAWRMETAISAWASSGDDRPAHEVAMDVVREAVAVQKRHSERHNTERQIGKT